MAVPRYEDRVHSGVGQSSAFICSSLALFGLEHEAEFTRPFMFERIGFPARAYEAPLIRVAVSTTTLAGIPPRPTPTNLGRFTRMARCRSPEKPHIELKAADTAGWHLAAVASPWPSSAHASSLGAVRRLSASSASQHRNRRSGVEKSRNSKRTTRLSLSARSVPRKTSEA